MRGLQHGVDWTELHFSLDSKWSAVLSENEYGSGQFNDEDYLQVESGKSDVRLGRIRSGFGFGSWADLWYSPIISAPICRFMPLADGIDLIDSESGVDIKAWRGNVQGELGAYDQQLGDHQALPRNIGFERARLQFQEGNAIIGLNALARHADFSSGSPHALGLDYRWNAPRVLLRGEMMQGYGPGKASGFYSDFTYRPPRFFRTQIAARIEGYDSDGPSRLYTTGLRQIVSSNLTLGLNYSWGEVPGFLSSMRGWHIQASWGVHFQ